MKQFQSLKKGFTLIEMLVVIAIIALLATLVVPAVTGALENAQRMTAMANGKGIYSSIFATVADAGSRRNYFPSATPPSGTPSYSTNDSTSYFKYLMDDALEIIPKDFGMFVAGGILPADDLGSFTADNNAWRVVEGVRPGDEASIPFMFTKNIDATTLGTDDSAIPMDEDEEPYQDKALVVIRIGGSGEALQKRYLFWDIVNPAEEDNTIWAP